MEFFADLFVSIVLAIYILLVGKCCFEESFVLDKKSIVVNLVTTVMDSLALSLFGESSVAYGAIDILSTLVLGWTILRGGKGILHRIAAFFQILFFLIMPIFVLADILAMQFAPSIMWAEKMDDIVMIIAVCLYFMEAVYVYWVLYRKKICVRFQGAEKIGLFSVTIFVWVVYGFMLVAEEDSYRNLQSGFLVLFILMLMVMYGTFMIAMVKNKTSAYYQQGQKFQEEWMKHELAYFKEYKKSQEETRRFRHDVTNNLSCLSALLQEEKQEEAQRYLNNMLGEIHAFSPKVVTGDEMLDCIISVKWEQMIEEGILFEVDGILDRGLEWEPIDICTVFSNALDNAIEACQKVTGKKVILLSLKRTKNFYYIEIKNSMNKELLNVEEVRSGKLFTTKKDKDIHGFGLENIKKIIYNHSGQVELDTDDEYFILRMIIPG
ncbi:MAG: GHKL domain-containing protein [Lachnospiraceae bacterium]|nr:GHKL domain-containing protein [Lachnospiraceae bacterium]